MHTLDVLVRRTQLILQEFGPSMAMSMLPGGYLVALSGWIYRHWPRPSASTK